nr:hypothetical protein [Methyloglobulus morosus]
MVTRPTAVVAPSATSGKPTPACFPKAAPERRQGDRRDRPHGALEQYPAPAGRPHGAENAFVFQGRNVA